MRSLETALKGISGGGEPCIKRQSIPDCGCKVAEGSSAEFSGEPWTVKSFGCPKRMHNTGTNGESSGATG